MFFAMFKRTLEYIQYIRMFVMISLFCVHELLTYLKINYYFVNTDAVEKKPSGGGGPGDDGLVCLSAVLCSIVHGPHKVVCETTLDRKS